MDDLRPEALELPLLEEEEAEEEEELLVEDSDPDEEELDGDLCLPRRFFLPCLDFSFLRLLRSLLFL